MTRRIKLCPKEKAFLKALDDRGSGSITLASLARSMQLDVGGLNATAVKLNGKDLVYYDGSTVRMMPSGELAVGQLVGG